MKFPRTLVFTTLALAAGSVLAHEMKPDFVIGYRQGVYKMIRWNFAPMVEMVKGEHPFDAAQFTRRATRLSFLSHQLDEAYPPGSGEGAPTDALPAIWEDHADFMAKLKDFQREARALRVVAETGDEARTKEQFVKTAGTCKACHDTYRAE